MFAMPDATISVFVAASRMPACAKTSLLPSASGIHSALKPSDSTSSARRPSSAAVMRSSSKLHTPIDPSRAAASRAVFIGWAHSPIHQAVPLRDHRHRAASGAEWRAKARRIEELGYDTLL